MIKLIDTMFLWNNIAVIGKSLVGGKDVVAVKHMSEEAAQYKFLQKSMGACCSGWKRCRPVDRASHALTLFNIMATKHGIPSAQVHEAFMEIEEYRAFHENTDIDGSSEKRNEFRDVYWAFGAGE